MRIDVDRIALRRNALKDSSSESPTPTYASGVDSVVTLKDLTRQLGYEDGGRAVRAALRRASPTTSRAPGGILCHRLRSPTYVRTYD